MPDKEFKNIKIAQIAAVCFCVDHPISNKTGANNIPPPMPIIPETNPIMAPITNNTYHLGDGFKGFSEF